MMMLLLPKPKQKLMRLKEFKPSSRITKWNNDHFVMQSLGICNAAYVGIHK